MKFGSIISKIKENRIDIAIILIIALILSLPLKNENIDIRFDDGGQHLTRAYESYESILKNGTDTIIFNLANGFGYSWNLFYGPLSTYLIMLFGIVFDSFNTGFKFVMYLIIVLSGISMYKLIYEMTENKNTSLLASVIYMTSPYFFTDVYIRHAMGECLAFVFIPMVFLGLYNLFNTEKNHYYLIFGASCLILSHNISTILTMIFAFIYCMLNRKEILESTRVKRGIIIDFIFILLITSFYWMPFLETRLYTDYRVYDEDSMANEISFLAYRINLKQLFVTKNDFPYVFEIGFPVISMLVFSWIVFRKIENDKREYLYFFICGMLSILMASKFFPWKIFPKIFYIMQFPWRILVFSSFFFAIICSINMSTLIIKFNIKDIFMIGLVCVLYIFSRFGFINYSENIVEAKDYKIGSISGQNNQYLAGMGNLEYLPSKAYENTFYMASKENRIYILEGKCTIEKEQKIESFLKAKINTEDESAKLELPYIYYPGYTVRFDGIIMETFETENGFLGCMIEPNEDGELQVEYTGSKIMNTSKVISVVAIVACIVYVWKKH